VRKSRRRGSREKGVGDEEEEEEEEEVMMMRGGVARYLSG
jgi:hypothetical protein